jgi:hypothetical protein
MTKLKEHEWKEEALISHGHTVSPLSDLGTRFTLLQPAVWFLNV